MLKAKHRQGGTFGNTAWCVPGGSPGHEVGAKERVRAQKNGPAICQDAKLCSRSGLPAAHGTPWKSFSRWSSDGNPFFKITVIGIFPD